MPWGFSNAAAAAAKQPSGYFPYHSTPVEKIVKVEEEEYKGENNNYSLPQPQQPSPPPSSSPNANPESPVNQEDDRKSADGHYPNGLAYAHEHQQPQMPSPAASVPSPASSSSSSTAPAKTSVAYPYFASPGDFSTSSLYGYASSVNPTKGPASASKHKQSKAKTSAGGCFQGSCLLSLLTNFLLQRVENVSTAAPRPLPCGGETATVTTCATPAGSTTK